MAAILLADAPDVPAAIISWTILAGTVPASCFFLAGLSPFPLLSGFLLLVLAALGAAAAGWSYFVFDHVCRPDMVALVRAWKRECVNNETGNKTSELLTVRSESGLKWQALRPSTAESHPSTAK